MQGPRIRHCTTGRSAPSCPGLSIDVYARAADQAAPDDGGAPPSGDFWDAVPTRTGVRMIVGDVRGCGPAAARTARRVVEDWRQISRRESTLRGIALRLDRRVDDLAGSEDPELFVSAVLLTFRHDGGCEIVRCGHPPVMVLGPGSAAWADAIPPEPPLGLGQLARSWAESTYLPFPPGARILLMTDGVTECRDPAGRFFPVAEEAASLTDLTGAALVSELGHRMRSHAGGAPADDTLLVLVGRPPA
ncbi:PP2C family protein-serine/threonine phosphatase [Streptomyces sp. Q6]|uniref:PP2C family protein-serine/threonine phosphatase n=1 Tax=Streptomyces citrinus TaxID=3118173 RepID=A0ACD5AEI8_9ACTN